jgi:hypothetical protein
MLLKFASRHGQTVSRSKLRAGVVVALLAIVILSLPYRLLRHNKFEVASWNGYRCYVIGQRETTILLFCPLSPVPRNHIVSITDSGVARTGVFENIFTQLSPSNGAEGDKP